MDCYGLKTRKTNIRMSACCNSSILQNVQITKYSDLPNCHQIPSKVKNLWILFNFEKFLPYPDMLFFWPKFDSLPSSTKYSNIQKYCIDLHASDDRLAQSTSQHHINSLSYSAKLHRKVCCKTSILLEVPFGIIKILIPVQCKPCKWPCLRNNLKESFTSFEVVTIHSH